MAKQYRVNLEAKATARAAVTARTESHHMIASNKERCRELLGAEELSEENIIDFLIALHIVMEVSLNTLFRSLSLIGIKKDIDDFEVAKNVDEINFIHKATLFIYNSKFDFSGGRLGEASHHHRIIGMLKDFAGPRNKLLHGHSIATIFEGEERRNSPLRENINPDYLNRQVNKFIEIMKGMRFYLDCLDSSLTDAGKQGFKDEFLDYSFLAR